MQTLSEFLEATFLEVNQEALKIGKKFEAGKDMSRYAYLEKKHRKAVDAICGEYSKTLRVPANSSANADLIYLFHFRLLEGMVFAQWLESGGFGEQRMPAEDWFLFLTVSAWNEFLGDSWKVGFLEFYRNRFPEGDGPPGRG